MQNKPLTRMTKKELAEIMLSLGYTQDQLVDENGDKLKRPDLLEKIKANQQGIQGLVNLNEIEEDDDIGVAVEQDEEKNNIVNETLCEEPENINPPSVNDPEWTQYVLGKFLEDEVDGQNPRVEGLRRVACELIGELVEEGCDLIAAPTEENRFRACAKAWGVFITSDGIQKRFEALADAHSENCLEDFATYLVAMADTRAKGRMFRNALCLRRVVAAEEISKTVATAADIQKGGPIHVSQISMIRLMADRYKLSITEILDSLGISYESNENTGDVNLQSLSYEDALLTAKRIREIKEEQKEGE